MGNVPNGQSSHLEFHKDLFLVLFSFLVYINDIVENVNCDIKMFADDTSLFSLVRDEARTAFELNCDLEKV